jgi:hypothetical protein
MKHELCLLLRQGDALSGSQVLVEVATSICFLTSFSVLDWAGGDWNHGLGVGDDSCSLAVIQQRSGAPNSTVFQVRVYCSTLCVILVVLNLFICLQAGDIICICVDCDSLIASVCRRSSPNEDNTSKLVSRGPRGPVRYKGFEYVTLHGHDPNSTEPLNECSKFVDPIEEFAGFTPASCDDDSTHVCTSLPWAAHALVFADGSVRRTGIDWEPWRPSIKLGKRYPHISLSVCIVNTGTE